VQRVTGRGLVAAGHPLVAAAAGDVLDAGGNAFDAVVAAGFTAAVCEPGFTSLGGGGFLLARTADGEARLVDFFVDTPGRGRGADAIAPPFDEVTVTWGDAVQSFHCGLGSVAVPGVLAGYLHVHRRLGSMPLRDLVGPAVRAAGDGITVVANQAEDFALLEPIFARTAAGRRLFLPEGRILGLGDTFRNPAFADLCQHLGDHPPAEGDDPLFEALRGLARRGEAGLLTVADIDAYRVVERVPLTFRYRDRTVLTNPPPSFGGTLLAAALVDLARSAPFDPDTAAGVLARAEVMRSVEDRRAVLLAPLGADGPQQSTGTTHVSVADAAGNVAAMTTSNGEGSGDVVPGTGVLLNNMLGEDDLHPDGFHAFAPGVRVASMMSPMVVSGPDGSVDLVIGSGGSKRIRSSILQVLTRFVDHGQPLAAAVDAPRIHWDDDHVEAEPAQPPGTEEALVAAGLGPVNRWTRRSMYFGGTHAVAPTRGEAAGDPRRGGAAFPD
jgi:gamma-glutamyltranspeptidase/glutathione hydrolase